MRREQQGVCLAGEQLWIGNSTGRNDTNHLAFDRPLAIGRVAGLFANGNRLTELDQFGQIRFDRMYRHPCHFYGLAGRLAA